MKLISRTLIQRITNLIQAQKAVPMRQTLSGIGFRFSRRSVHTPQNRIDNHPQPDFTPSVSRTFNESWRKKGLASAHGNFRTGNYQEALYEYSKVLIFNEESITKLTEEDRNISAEAYYHMAKILQVGSLEDEKLSFLVLDKAINLKPNYKEALELKRAMNAEYGIVDISKSPRFDI